MADSINRVAVVTGGASGMGEATCHELGRRGHKVAVLDLDGEAAQRVSEDLRAQDVTALAVGADVSDRSAVEEAFAKIRILAARFRQCRAQFRRVHARVVAGDHARGFELGDLLLRRGDRIGAR